MKLEFYKTFLTFGICANVDHESKEATELLEKLTTLIKKCDMPDCTEEAVRVGVYPTENRNELKGSEFRGLCERHKQTGMNKYTRRIQ